MTESQKTLPGKWSSFLPMALVYLRLLLSPVLLWDALDGKTGLFFVLALSLAILSDILDGIFARRLNIANQKFRRLDSLVDSIFFLFVAAAAWIAHRESLLPLSNLLFTMFALWILSQVPALIRFSRLPAFHAYSAKAAGLALLAAAIQLFGYSRAGPLFQFALWIAILSHLERIAISLVLPEWQTDIDGIWMALKIRRNIAK